MRGLTINVWLCVIYVDLQDSLTLVAVEDPLDACDFEPKLKEY